ncbi:hypothetical protein JTE90_015607 [Oedothorax gibbosus]|uniref:tRNA (32-2'-O)-methyltransferase regulator THADA n=1 Tax=Oedothorax gibbosus TaxID=931172 RepID=A0AAV6UTT4_9ARAC|nr:hypothetical protein JTE90_015607 [Oedothorax gibbosus]
MRLKRKASEKIIFSISEHEIKIIKDNSKSSCDNGIVERLNSAEDGIQQMKILKEIQKDLSQKSEDELFKSQADILVLCYTFYQSPLKSSHKKSLNRMFREISNLNSKVVLESLQLSLEGVLEGLLRNISITEINISADCLLGLLDNFPIGATVITNLNELVWNYFCDSLTYIVESLKKSTSTELYSSCQSVLKVFTTVHQNGDNFLLVKTLKAKSLSAYYEKVVDNLKYLLKSEFTTLNCRLNAGISLCYHSYSLDPTTFRLNFLNQNENNFEAEKFPPSSQLCMYSGIMAVFPIHEFASSQNGKIVAEQVLRKILEISDSVGDSDLLLLCVRDLIQWSNIMSNILCCKSKQPLTEEELGEVKKLFQADSEVMEMIFQYVLHYREHYVDTLRHLTKDLFRNILNLHVLSLDHGIPPSLSTLLERMACYLLNDVSPYSQGKYGLLACIVDIVGTRTILKWYPPLPDTLFYRLDEASLISHVCDLLETLFRKYDSTDENFRSTWLEPLLGYLCELPKEQLTAINEQLLPKLFKVQPNSICFLQDELSTMWQKCQGNCFSSLIVAVKFRQRQEPDKSIFDFISRRSLVRALSHSDDQIRLSAWSLICESPRTTEPVPADILDLIRSTLKYNMNCQSPAFRQQFVASLKKLFNRMEKSGCAIDRRLLELKRIRELGNSTTETRAEDFQLEELLIKYDDFLNWLKKDLYKFLFPGANFPRRVTTLNLLSALCSVYGESLDVVSKPSEIQTLLYALKDTYENNKISALKVLFSCDSLTFERTIARFSESIFKAALTLTASSKPPDTVTASYFFSVFVEHNCFWEHIEEHLSEQVKDNMYLKNVVDLPSFDVGSSTAPFTTTVMLAGELLRHLNVAQISLLNAAAYTPLYGVLACIRKVISEVEFRHLHNSETALWSCLIQELISLSIQVAATVEPVVCNSSPEGHLPMDTDSENIEQLQTAVRRAIGNRFHSAVVDPDSQSSATVGEGVVLDLTKTRAVTAQILLLCCWRTHKEVSLLFGEMAEKIPVSDGDEKSLLSVSQVMNIGEYFIRQMTLVKHKGAFEQAFIGFSQLCHMLWRSNIKVLNELPKEWLRDLFLAIRGLKDNSHLCSTRRSAGLPFIVQALLTSDPGLSNSLFFKNTISSLLGMALGEKGKQEEKIHALNILRALFRDACLSDVLIPFVSEGLKASIIGFKSQSWAVRNSSTLLFSSLMIRIFGVNHTNDDTNKKNRLTGKTFFTYHKDTYSFLYNEMEYCAAVLSKDQNSISLVPALYPILLLLGRLYPAPGDNDPRLASFIPFLRICGNSAVWKVRVLTAKALVPLISVENMVATLHSLFDSLPKSDADKHYQNQIHGSCLQIVSILKEIANVPENIKESIKEHLPEWIKSYFHIASVNNKCYATRAAFLEIFLQALTMDVTIDVSVIQQLVADTQLEIRKDGVSPDNEHYLCLAATASLLSLLKLRQNDMKVVLREISGQVKCFTDLVQDLLRSPHEIVHSTVLHFLVFLFRKESGNESFDYELSFYPVYFKDIFSVAVCSAIDFCDKDVRCEVECSEDFYKYLLNWFSDCQVNGSCSGIIYQLFTVLHQIIDLKWEFLSSLRPQPSLCNCLKLKYVLEHLRASKRDDVANEIMLYATSISVKIIKALWQAEQGDSDVTCFECTVTIKRWCLTLNEWVQPGNCLAKRKTAAKCFQSIFEPTSVAALKTLEDDAADLWQGLAFLVMDDEPEIKDIAINIVTNYQCFKRPHEATPPVVSELALDYLIKLMIKEKFCSPITYATVLLNWMLACQKLDTEAVGDEQPFDRGELNVFAEDLTLTRIAGENLRRLYLRSDTKILNLRISCWATTTQRTSSLYEISERCIAECEGLLRGIVSRSSGSVFLDPFFDNSVIQICQRLSVYGSLSNFVVAYCRDRAKMFAGVFRHVDGKTVFMDAVVKSFAMSISYNQLSFPEGGEYL